MDTGVTGTLTDGTGVSSLTVPKIAKDFIVDFVKTLAAVFVAAQITGVQNVLDDPHKAIIAATGALFSTGYRFILKWGESAS